MKDIQLAAGRRSGGPQIRGDQGRSEGRPGFLKPLVYSPDEDYGFLAEHAESRGDFSLLTAGRIVIGCWVVAGIALGFGIYAAVKGAK